MTAKVGRPTDYKPEYADQAKKLCALGATDVDLADFFGVSINTIGNWKTRHPEFLGALKAGKEPADERVERSLYQRATGYTHDAVKIFPPKGEGTKALIVEYREHVAPDTTACIFWLKNRKSEEWRDRQEHQLTGKNGGPIETKDVSDHERARALAAFMARTGPVDDQSGGT